MDDREPEVEQEQDQVLHELPEDIQGSAFAAASESLAKLVTQIKAEAQLVVETFRFIEPKVGNMYKMYEDPEVWGEITSVEPFRVSMSIRVPPVSERVFIEFVTNARSDGTTG